MTKKIVILNLVLISSLAFSQSANSVLYKISGNELKQPSYVMGIINFLPASRFKIPAEVEKAMQSCEAFVTKTLIKKSIQKKFNHAVRIPNNGWINDYLTDDELNQLRLLLLLDYEVKENAYHDFYSRLQPIILVTTTAALDLKDDIVYLEKTLHDRAKGYKLKNYGLGTIEEEIASFKKFPIEDQVEALKYTVNNFYEHIDNFKKMTDAYLIDQDLNYVKDETFKATNKSQAFKKVYYDARALQWLPKIEKMMGDKPTFMALGAPYLVGPQGIIELLTTKGYTVEAVPVTF